MLLNMFLMFLNFQKMKLMNFMKTLTNTIYDRYRKMLINVHYHYMPILNVKICLKIY